ncbi:MAG: substrate-binding domain-containing protein [Dehalococcoidia bacterium]|nr:substrate-binding domain-containing protein [Dehalococcoidia bacterium]
MGKYQFILSPGNTEPRQIAERWASNMGVKLDVIVETTSYDALKEGAMQGLGLSVVPETIVHEDVQAGRLCVVRLAGLPCDRLICLVYNPQRKLSSAAEAMRHVVQDGHWREQMLIHNPC